MNSDPKRRHLAISLALILSFALDASAQSGTGRVTGTVVEARTGAPLVAVLVKVQSTKQQAFSDQDGRFEIADVPSGPHTLLVSVVGFGLVRRDVTVVIGEAVDVSIPVAEGASTYVEDVAVSGSPFREAEPGVASQTVLGSRDLLALRGLIADDPFRAVQVLPGVATGDDFRAEFAVRGLGPSNIGIAVDGVDSPLLFHTVRGVQDTGSLALINSDILDTATLMAGVHPQRLGSHLGSRLDFTTRDGSRDRLTVRGLVSASAASTVWEGPLGAAGNAGWLVAVRKSYIDWLLRKIDSTTDTTFGFTDAQGKITLDLTPRQTLRVSMVAGRSVLHENDLDPGVNTLDRAENTTFVGNLQWRFTPSARFAVSQQAYLLKAGYQNRVIDGRTREEGGDLDITWRGAAEWNPRSGHFVEFGAQAQSLDVDRLDRTFSGTRSTTLLDKRVGASSQAIWTQYRWTPSTRVVLTPGVRVERWGLIDRTEASPWLLSEWEVLPGTRMRFGIGQQFQAPTIDHTFYTLPGTVLAPARAHTIELGVEQRFGAAWRVAGTLYDRSDHERFRFRNGEALVVGDRVVVPSNPYIVNALSGDTLGAEVVVERRSANGLTGWLSYAWSDSRLTDVGRAGPDGRPEKFHSDFDQNHTMNAYVAYRWSGRTSLSARMRYGSNFPIQGYIQPVPNGLLLGDRRNRARLPAYSRLDLRADRTFTYRKSRLTLFMEVVNATGRENFRPNSPSFNARTREVFGAVEKLFPLLPVAGILIEF
jgi:hypothetical protein